MLGLRAAVVNGLIDCIATHHLPQDWDNKTCEFEYAKNGMTGLETAFAVVNHVLPELTYDQLVKIFSLNARNIFTLFSTNINKGNSAELTLFTKKQQTRITKSGLRTKSANTPFIEMDLNGKILGIIYKGHLTLN